MNRKALTVGSVLGLEISFILCGLFFYIHVYQTNYPSLYDPRVKSKLEPWLWDKLKLLEANGTTRFYSIIIRTDCRAFGQPEGYEGRKKIASFLVENHNATILYVANVLSSIILKVSVPEIKEIALYNFVELIGDGEVEVVIDN